jgi:SHS2 domain-containing protein
MPSPPFEILEHTADVGLRAFGASISELYVNAARGMVALALDTEEGTGGVPPEQSRKLSASGEDREELLVNFLSEVLFALDTEGWRFGEFRIQKLDATSIEAEAWGQKVQYSEHNRVAVKAVTYHQLSVMQKNGAWEAVVYFDI